MCQYSGDKNNRGAIVITIAVILGRRVLFVSAMPIDETVDGKLCFSRVEAECLY